MITKDLVIDPVAIQSQFIEKINSNSGFDISDPTNSFAMLLEANTSSLHDGLNELFSYERKFFPHLAKNMDDLFPHMIGFDEKDLFASPATASIRVWVDLNSIYQYGEKDTTGTIYKVTIPKFSFVEVDNTDLTIMNDVNITVNTHGNNVRVFIENKITEDSFAFVNKGNTVSGIMVDENNVEWVVFDVPVMQVSHISAKDIITTGIEYRSIIPFTDEFYFTKVSYINDSGEEKEIHKIFTDTEYDPNKLSVYVRVIDNQVQYVIPSTYTKTGMITGEISIIIYSTKGKVKIPLTEYNPSDYSFTISRESTTIAAASSAKVNYRFTSTDIVDGGVNTRPIKDVKNKIIYRIGNRSDLPITEKQLKERSKLDGFVITKVLDSITKRLYIASKNINDIINNELDAPIDAFNSIVLFRRNSIDSYTNIDTTYLEKTIIKPGCLFKSINGVVTAMNDIDLQVLSNVSENDKIDYLNNNNIFYTPFLYIIINSSASTTSRVYDIDRTRMDMITIKSKNYALKENVNINGYNIFRTNMGYDIFFSVIGNDSFENIKNNIAIQFTLINSIGDKSSFHSTIDAAKTLEKFGEDKEALHYIHIPSSFYIDDSNKLLISNPNSTPVLMSIDINTVADILIYHKGNSIVANNVDAASAIQYLNGETINIVGSTDYIGMTRENIKVIFADYMEYLWRKVLVSHSDREYKKHSIDVPLTYTKNIYEDNGTCPITIIKNSDGTCDTVTLNIKHNIGDTVMNDQNIPILKHKIGDVLLGANDKPIFDKINGMSMILDIFMLEYNYVSIGKDKFKRNIKESIDLVRNWVLKKMPAINDIALEQTKILYKPTRSNGSVKLYGDNINSVISPKVTIYINKLTNREDIDHLKLFNSIGAVLNKFFGKQFIAIDDLEKEIQGLVPSADAVKVSNFLENDPMVIDLEDSSTRFVLKKIINDSFDIVYDYDLELK